MTKKGHQNFRRQNGNFFLKKCYSKIWSAKFCYVRPPSKLGARSPPMATEQFLFEISRLCHNRVHCKKVYPQRKLTAIIDDTEILGIAVLIANEWCPRLYKSLRNRETH